MRKIVFSLICLWVITSVVRAEPTIYELVRFDGQVVARTEVQPSVGDAYWDAHSDEWYTVLKVQGTAATVGTQAETKRFYLLRNLRLAGGMAVFIASLAYYTRQRRRAAKRE